MRIYISIRGIVTTLICFIVDSLDGSTCFDCSTDDCIETCESDACFYMRDFHDPLSTVDGSEASLRRHFRDVSFRSKMLESGNLNRIARETRTATIKGCVDFLDRRTFEISEESGFVCVRSIIGYGESLICICVGENCNARFPRRMRTRTEPTITCRFGNVTSRDTCVGNACLRLSQNGETTNGCASRIVGRLKGSKPDFEHTEFANSDLLEDLFDEREHCLDFGPQKRLCTCFENRCNQRSQIIDLNDGSFYNVQCNTSSGTCLGNACGIDFSKTSFKQVPDEQYCYQLIDREGSIGNQATRTRYRSSALVRDSVKCSDDFCNANLFAAERSLQRALNSDIHGSAGRKRSLTAMVFGYIGLFFVVLMFLWIVYICCSYQFQLFCVKHNSGSVWRKKSSHKKRERELREKEDKDRKAFLDRQKRHAQSLKIHGSEPAPRPRLTRALSDGDSVLTDQEREKYERLLAKLEAKDREKANAAKHAAVTTRLSRIDEHEHWDDEGSTVILEETPVYATNGHVTSNNDVFDDGSSTTTNRNASPPPASAKTAGSRSTMAKGTKETARARSPQRVNNGGAPPQMAEQQFAPLSEQEIQKVNRLLSRASWNRSLRNPKVNLALVADEL